MWSPCAAEFPEAGLHTLTGAALAPGLYRYLGGWLLSSGSDCRDGSHREIILAKIYRFCQLSKVTVAGILLGHKFLNP